MTHEMTLVTDIGETSLTCSCGVTVFRQPGGASLVTRIPYSEVSLAAAAHLQPEMDTILRDLLRKISVRDIIRDILRRRT
jgi:hypothetical protein